ncbi:MAG TPA: hypothetical protein VF746_07115 [Longimicrobium sp.]|jgi:hypothetical protein
MRFLLALIGLAALLAGGWYFREHIPGPWRKKEPVAVSPEAARSAEEKLERLRSDGETVRLSDVEFTSYVRYRYQDAFSGQVSDPAVDFEGDRVTVTGRFPTDRLPDTRQTRAIREFLPDTADVKVSGGLRTLGPGRAALRVDNASFARVPVPADVYPDVLKSAGRRDEPGLAPNEYAVPLPPGVGSARVERGELVLSPPAGR